MSALREDLVKALKGMKDTLDEIEFLSLKGLCVAERIINKTPEKPLTNDNYTSTIEASQENTEQEENNKTNYYDIKTGLPSPWNE